VGSPKSYADREVMKKRRKGGVGQRMQKERGEKRNREAKRKVK
jgi:hypothetical protein